MAYETGTASDYADLRKKLLKFLLGLGTWGTVTFTGSGNGTITKGSIGPVDSGTTKDTVTETWTIACTATAMDGGTFSVTGSVSGAQTPATVGTPYDNGKIKFTISDGSVDFFVGDTFSFTTTQGATAASNEYWVYDGVDASGGYWVHGRGGSGTDHIYFGTKLYSDTTSDIYNLQIASATNFVSGSAFSGQPGYSGDSYLLLWNTDIQYWFVANRQRVVFCSKVSTTYHTGYVGKLFPYGLPSEYGYPVIVGGETSTAATRWSTVSESVRNFFNPGQSAGTRLCFPGGTWNVVANYADNGNGGLASSSPWVTYYCHMWPYATDNIAGYTNDTLNLMRDNIDGSYSLFPIIPVASQPAKGVFGELDGCYYVSGFNNASQNIITIGGVDYMVIQDMHRTDRASYFALKLV